MNLRRKRIKKLSVTNGKIRKLENELELFEAVFDLSEIGITVADNNGTIIKANKSHEYITGREHSTIIGKNMEDISKEGNYESAIMRTICTGKKIKDEQHKSNGKSYFVYSIPYYKNINELKYVVSNVVDINEINYVKKKLEQSRKIEEGLRLKINELKELTASRNSMVYCSDKMQNIVEICEKVAMFDSTILITGESGTGKELIANYIHSKSSRKDEPFIKVNCASIPEQLMESELFGYEAGSFTSASSKGKKGLLELANNGTLLLDEIGDMSISLQPKILRFLQEGEALRVGGKKPISSDVRIIAVTNHNLEELVRQGRFREDLFYRLNVIPIHLPSLNERKSDIPHLIHYFTNKLNQKYCLEKRFDKNAIEYLMAIKLPGNIRELKNIVERLVMLSGENTITLRETFNLLNKGIIDKDANISLKEFLQHFERIILESYLKEYRTTKKISEKLNVSQSTISRKLMSYDLSIQK